MRNEVDGVRHQRGRVTLRVLENVAKLLKVMQNYTVEYRACVRSYQYSIVSMKEIRRRLDVGATARK